MTAKEKAQELFDHYWWLYSDDDSALYMDSSMSKKCALIAVDEMLEELSNEDMYPKSNYIFWQEVKQELEKL